MQKIGLAIALIGLLLFLNFLRSFPGQIVDIESIGFAVGYFLIPSLLLGLGLIMIFLVKRRSLSTVITSKPITILGEQVIAQIHFDFRSSITSGYFRIKDIENEDKKDLLNNKYKLTDFRYYRKKISFLVPITEDKKEWLYNGPQNLNHLLSDI